MESELKDLNPKSLQPDPIDDGSSAKDDRPLLKPDAAAAVIPPPPVSASTIEELEKKFAAYVRSDVYGTMGRGELPWTEKLLLGIAFFTLLPVRVAVVMTILVVYYLVCRVCTMCLAPNREDSAGQEDYAHTRGWRRAVIVRAGKFFSRAILLVLGFYWINETNLFNDQTKNYRAVAVYSQKTKIKSHCKEMESKEDLFPRWKEKIKVMEGEGKSDKGE